LEADLAALFNALVTVGVLNGAGLAHSSVCEVAHFAELALILLYTQLAVLHKTITSEAYSFLVEEVAIDALSTVDVLSLLFTEEALIHNHPAGMALSFCKVGSVHAGETNDAGAGLAVGILFIAFVAKGMNVLEVISLDALLTVSGIQAGYAAVLSIGASHTDAVFGIVLLLAHQTLIG
jgi:hypothetical protein